MRSRTFQTFILLLIAGFLQTFSVASAQQIPNIQDDALRSAIVTTAVEELGWSPEGARTPSAVSAIYLDAFKRIYVQHRGWIDEYMTERKGSIVVATDFSVEVVSYLISSAHFKNRIVEYLSSGIPDKIFRAQVILFLSGEDQSTISGVLDENTKNAAKSYLLRPKGLGDVYFSPYLSSEGLYMHTLSAPIIRWNLKTGQIPVFSGYFPEGIADNFQPGKDIRHYLDLGNFLSDDREFHKYDNYLLEIDYSEEIAIINSF